MITTFRVVATFGALLGGVGFGWAVHSVGSQGGLRQSAPFAIAAEGSKSGTINPDPRAREETSKSFFDRLHEAMGISGRAKRQRLIAGLADGFDAGQIREALSRVSKSRIPNRKEVMAQLFARWGELEPLAAIEFANSLDRLSDRREAISAIVNGWMEQNPEAAEKWAEAQTDRALQRAAWEAIIPAYAAVDPRHALALAQKSKLSWRGMNSVADAIFGRWAAQDPAGAAAQATALPQGFLRMEAACIVATQWAETDPQRAMEWAQSLPDLLLNEDEGFGGSTTRMGADRSNAARRVVEIWLKRNPDEAALWLSQLPNDSWKANLLHDAISSNLESAHDPEIALQLADLFPEGLQRRFALEYTAERLGQNDPELAPTLLSYEMDDQSRKSIIPGLVETLKGDNLLAALRQTRPGEIPLGAFTVWADPETAMGWAIAQPDHEKVLARIAAAWMAKEPALVEEIVRMIPPALKNGVLSGAVESSFYGPPYSPEERAAKFERAGNWIAEITDPILRQTTYRQLAERWMQTDSESARRWIETIPIDSQVKRELLKPQPEIEMDLD